MLSLKAIVRKRRLQLSGTAFTIRSMYEAPLKWTKLPHEGAFIDLISEPPVAGGSNFSTQLQETVASLAKLSMKSCWLQIPIEMSELAALANRECGFCFHHAKDNILVMKLWLQDGEDKVPDFATHQVGCAGFVLNEETGQLLVVKEKVSILKRKKDWKLPGGLLEVGESFAAATTREVLEETGVETIFESVLCFWHRECNPMTMPTWKVGDFYVVSLLRPTSHDIMFDPNEISECRWMDLNEFVATQNHPLILKISDIVFGLRKDKVPAPGIPATARLKISEHSVQWPGREPYPTFFGDSSLDRS